MVDMTTHPAWWEGQANLAALTHLQVALLISDGTFFGSFEKMHEHQSDKLERNHVPFETINWMVPDDGVQIVRQNSWGKDGQ